MTKDNISPMTDQELRAWSLAVFAMNKPGSLTETGGDLKLVEDDLKLLEGIRSYIESGSHWGMPPP